MNMKPSKPKASATQSVPPSAAPPMNAAMNAPMPPQTKEAHSPWIRIPEKNATPEAWDEFLQKLGKPKEASGYEFPMMDDPLYDQGLLEEFKIIAHKVGLTKEQALMLHDEMIKILHLRKNFQNEQMLKNQENTMMDLKKSWGNDLDKNLSLAQKAAKYFGLNEETLQLIENQTGSHQLLDTLKKIGHMLGDDTQLLHMQSQSFQYNAEDAKKKRAELTRNPDFLAELMDKMHPNHKAAVEELDRLNQIITQ